jgi:hypothetical protein
MSIIKSITYFIETEGISLDNNLNILDDEIDEIKKNPLKIADLFIKIFNPLYKILKYSNDSEIKNFLEENKKRFNILFSLQNDISNYPISFGKHELEKKIIKYVEKNYFELGEFIDVFLEVSS